MYWKVCGLHNVVRNHASIYKKWITIECPWVSTYNHILLLYSSHCTTPANTQLAYPYCLHLWGFWCHLGVCPAANNSFSIIPTCLFDLQVSPSPKPYRLIMRPPIPVLHCSKHLWDSRPSTPLLFTSLVPGHRPSTIVAWEWLPRLPKLNRHNFLNVCPNGTNEESINIYVKHIWQ